jgi:hypothetical protein
MGKTRKGEVYKRRQEVKRLYLKGMTPAQIVADADFVTKYGKLQTSTIRKDIKEINNWYLAAVEKNPNILEKQAEYILKHLDELKLIKQKLWEIEAAAGSDKDRITALKGVLDELNHEARVLKLIDVSKTIHQYIHVNKIGMLVNGTIALIKEFVPLDKQKYALDRLKAVGRNIIDIKTR